MPQFSTILPAITTMLGPRVVPDTAATRPLVHSEISQRFDLHVADLAYVLGDDHAKKFLASDLKSFPTLATQLDAARVVLKSAPGAPTCTPPGSTRSARFPKSRAGSFRPS